MAVAYKKKIGFKGQFYIEPKPKEPTIERYGLALKKSPLPGSDRQEMLENLTNNFVR